MPLFGGFAEPTRRLGIAAPNTFTLAIHSSELVLGITVSLPSRQPNQFELCLHVNLGVRFAPPALRLRLVLLDPAAFAVHPPDIELCLGIALFGGVKLMLEPPSGGRIVKLLEPQAAPEQLDEQVLCLGMPSLNGLKPPIRRLVAVLFCAATLLVHPAKVDHRREVSALRLTQNSLELNSRSVSGWTHVPSWPISGYRLTSS